MPSLLLDLRFPFCPMGCNFCQKKLHDPRILGRDGYSAALEREIRSAAKDVPEYTVEAVRLGGGIPSRIFDRELGKLLITMRKVFSMEEAEISLHCHPSLFTAETLLDCRRGKIGRLCVELLTTDPVETMRLGREYEEDSLRFFKMLLGDLPVVLSFSIGIGIKGQTKTSLQKSLWEVMGFGAKEISLLPFDGAGEELWDCARDLLQREGFRPYLENRYALPGGEYRYAVLKEKNTEYLGFGCGAETKLDGIFSRNTEDLAKYLRFSAEAEKIVEGIQKL